MIKEFEDGSYIEFREGDDPNSVVVCICSRDSSNFSVITTQTVSIDKVEFSTLVKDFVKLPKSPGAK